MIKTQKKMAKKKKYISHKNNHKLRDIGKTILRLMNQNTSKIYNYKQISDGINYKNPRQREQVKLCISFGQKIKSEKPKKANIS